MKTYCYDCGAKLEFSPRDKPKFCSKCGIPLESSGKIMKKPQKQINEDIEIDDETLSVSASITALDFEFDQETQKDKGVKLSSLMGTLDASQISDVPASNLRVTNEEAMEQFKKEAGSLRQSSNKKDAQAWG